MNIRNPLLYALFCLLVMVVSHEPITGQEKRQPAPITAPIRIGVVDYGDYDSAYKRNQPLFSQLFVADSKHKDRPGFRLDIGSYDDVYNWYRNGYVDVAILSTGAVGQLLNAPGGEEQLTNLYIGTRRLDMVNPRNSFATARRKGYDTDHKYQAFCLVKKGSPIKSLPDLIELAGKGRVHFLFVDPLSVSGGILPRHVLQKHQIDIRKNQVEWTYGHGQSLRLLKTPDKGDVVKVAFVWDGAELDGKPLDDSTFYKVPIPELEKDEYWIPQEIVLLHPNFLQHKEQVARLLTASHEFDGNQKDWVKDYKRVVDWIRSLNLSPDEESQRGRTLDQIISKVVEYERYHPGQTRLALVLSGGGAKCAYQVGATEAIEEALEKVETKEGHGLDLDLIVGTSGGAINALGFALGLDHTSEGRRTIRETWLSFDQGDFFRPWSPVSLVVGIVLGLFQATVIILIIPLFSTQPITWPKYAAKAVLGLLVIGGVLILSGLTSWAVIPALGICGIMALTLLNNAPPNSLRTAAWLLSALGIIELAAALSGWTPWSAFPVVFWILVAILEAILLILVVRLVAPTIKKWWIPAGAVLTVTFGIEFLLWEQGSLRVGLINNEGQSHVLRHLWLFVTLNLLLTSLLLIAFGIGLYLLSRRHVSSEFVSFVRRRSLKWAALIMVSVVALQIGRSVLLDDSLTDTSGIENVLARSMPKLLGDKSTLRPSGRNSQRLKEFSREIINRDLLTHDLIITSSRLPTPQDSKGTKNALPQELYFYYQRPVANGVPGRLPPDKRFPADPRFISLRDDPYKEHLLDIVIGSSSIYPVFQPRLLPRSLIGDEAKLELIDGGFAHNSPIEAAVAWGATHIILIEASPQEEPSVRGNLLSNSGAAFNYLFNQAQLLDVHSRGKVEIFTLRPELAKTEGQFNLCTFDFSPSLIQTAMDLGLRDALDKNTPRFHREGGQPLF